MAEGTLDDTSLQLVTFKLGNELYGVNVMDVKEIVKIQNIRAIPNTPYYMLGILNLRSEVIPIIDLHRRFHIGDDENVELDELESGFIILRVQGMEIGIIIDRVAKVTTIDKENIKDPPQMMGGIASEYIIGVVQVDESYLIILDTQKLFEAKELQKIVENPLVKK